MWRSLGQVILRYRIQLLCILLVLTALMGYWASQVRLSYEFARAIPADHPIYKMYKEFKKKYGDDGNLLVIGVRTDSFFQADFFNNYAALDRDLKTLSGVENIISIPSGINLVKVSETEK